MRLHIDYSIEKAMRWPLLHFFMDESDIAFMSTAHANNAGGIIFGRFLKMAG